MQLLARTLARLQQQCAAEVSALTERQDDIHAIEGIITGLEQRGIRVQNTKAHASAGSLVVTTQINGRDYENVERLLLDAGLWARDAFAGAMAFAGEINGRPYTLGIYCLPSFERVAA